MDRWLSRTAGVVLVAGLMLPATGCADRTQTGITTSASASASTEAAIAEQRNRIDELDRRIIELIRERKGVSARIQQLRIAAGGGRVDPSREQLIIARYRDAFGERGVGIAQAILDASRGTAPSSPAATAPVPAR